MSTKSETLALRALRRARSYLSAAARLERDNGDTVLADAIRDAITQIDTILDDLSRCPRKASR